MIKILIIFFNLIFSVVFAYNDYTSKAKDMINAGDKYHKDVYLIRKMHPDFMNHKRDKTLRQGIRSEEFSLKACVNCHASKNKDAVYVNIDSDGQFCSNCHKQVGVTIDCFGCHRTTPEQ